MGSLIKEINLLKILLLQKEVDCFRMLLDCAIVKEYIGFQALTVKQQTFNLPNGDRYPGDPLNNRSCRH